MLLLLTTTVTLHLYIVSSEDSSRSVMNAWDMNLMGYEFNKNEPSSLR